MGDVPGMIGGEDEGKLNDEKVREKTKDRRKAKEAEMGNEKQCN